MQLDMGGKPKSSTSFACCTGTAAQGRAAVRGSARNRSVPVSWECSVGYGDKRVGQGSL